VGNRIAAALVLIALAAVAIAVWLASLARSTAPPPRLILYVETEGAASRKLFAQFRDELAARLVDPGSVIARFVAIVDVREDDIATLGVQLARSPAVVVATSGGAAALVRTLDPRIPIVFATNADPVVTGLVRDLNRPGGPQTGITSALPTFKKRIEILAEAVPSARRIGILLDQGEGPDAFGFEDRTEADLPGLTLRWREARDEAQIHDVITGTDGRSIDAWYVPYNGLSFRHGGAILEALAAARRPALFDRAKFADSGGLAAYQHTVEEPAARLAEMVAGVLAGVPPGDIPVVRPTRFELVVNLDAARRLGLTIPKPVVKRADRVID
jgi:putative ABC transport system substrate-binding protein